MTFDLFVEQEPSTRNFFYFASRKDKSGALKHLQSLALKEIEREVLMSGYSMISRSHGKQQVMLHAVNQIGIKEPVARDYSFD